MTQELVANIGFGRIQRLGMMANVLGREKDAKGQAIQKVARTQETSDGPHLKIGALLQKFANVLLLRDIVSAVSTMPLEEIERSLWRSCKIQDM
jgi:hypothetical protein